MVFKLKKDSKGASVNLRAFVNNILTVNDEFWSRRVERSLHIGNTLYMKS